MSHNAPMVQKHAITGKRFDSEFHVVHKQINGDRFAGVGIVLNGDGAVDNQISAFAWERFASKGEMRLWRRCCSNEG